MSFAIAYYAIEFKVERVTKIIRYYKLSFLKNFDALSQDHSTQLDETKRMVYKKCTFCLKT